MTKQKRIVLMDSRRGIKTPDSISILELVLLYAKEYNVTAPDALRHIILTNEQLISFAIVRGLKVLP